MHSPQELEQQGKLLFPKSFSNSDSMESDLSQLKLREAILESGHSIKLVAQNHHEQILTGYVRIIDPTILEIFFKGIKQRISRDVDIIYSSKWVTYN